MSDTTVAPARWYAHWRPGDPADVLVPVDRSEPAEPLDFGPLDSICVPRTVHGPGDVPTPPGSIIVTREEETSWWGRRERPRTLAVVILRVAAAEWQEQRDASLYFRGPVPRLTDLHTGVEWTVSEWAGIFGPGATATADPPETYEVPWPPAWSDVTRDTSAVLAALVGPHTPIGTSRRGLADTYPLAGWDVPTPGPEDRP